MFERYTEKARRVIFFARYEASQFGSPYIETEHLPVSYTHLDVYKRQAYYKAQQQAIAQTLTAAGLNPEQIAVMLFVPLDFPPKKTLRP